MFIEKCYFSVSCQFSAKSGVIDQLRSNGQSQLTCWPPLV